MAHTTGSAMAGPLAGLTVLLAAALSGCTAPADPGEPSATATPTASAEAAACVASPDGVASAELPAGATDDLDDGLADELRTAAEDGLALASTAGAIVAVRTPEGTWVEAFGEADPRSGTPMAADQYLRIGSVTKTFTGSLILQLAEEGALGLDDPISDHVDGVPNGDDISLRQLMDMTSGIPSYSLDPATADRYLAEPQTVWTPQELLDAAFGLDPLFEPGAQFNYSNTNFILLGLVVEEVAGRPYPEVLRERILDPLGLDHTSFPETSDIPDPHAAGFSLQGTPDDSQEPIEATDWSPTFAWTAGQLISTADDLLDYGRALATGQGLLDEAAAVDRLTSFPGEEGYGLAVGCIEGWVGHTGEIPGYNTSLFHDTANDTTVVVMTNSDVLSGDCSVSKTLADDPRTASCMAPATRIFVELADALGHPFTPPPAQ